LSHDFIAYLMCSLSLPRMISLFTRNILSLAIISSMTASNYYFTGNETTVENLIQELAVCSNGRMKHAPIDDDVEDIYKWLWKYFPIMLDNTGKARSSVLNIMSQFVLDQILF